MSDESRSAARRRAARRLAERQGIELSAARRVVQAARELVDAHDSAAGDPSLEPTTRTGEALARTRRAVAHYDEVTAT